MAWWNKKLALAGTVLFRGDLAPKPEEFAFLEASGIALKPFAGDPNKWLMEMTHPQWGSARLATGQGAPLPPRELFEYALIPRADKDAAISARSAVAIRMDSKYDHVLRDRKQLLRFLRAVMAEDGVVAADMLSGRVWTREELDEELAHDADLDVEGIITYHVVADEKDEHGWFHTHGLSEVGGFDFDIFDPSEETILNIQDLCRALAFHILEGSVGPSTPNFDFMRPKGKLRLVEMDRFIENTDPDRRREYASGIDQYHRKNHSVLCEPEGSFLGRMFGGKALQPVKFLTRELPENPVFAFSNAATDLMAERARKTYSLFRSLCREFAPYDFPCLVKLGLRVDGGAENEREHMWFAVHELFDDSIDATLENQPYNVSGIKQGDRRRHSVDLITDWTIFTPAGMINPRTTAPARILRSNPEALKKMLEAMKEEQ